VIAPPGRKGSSAGPPPGFPQPQCFDVKLGLDATQHVVVDDIPFVQAGCAPTMPGLGAPGGELALLAVAVSDRGDEFYERFTEGFDALLAEQETGACAFHVPLAEDGSVIGRFLATAAHRVCSPCLVEARRHSCSTAAVASPRPLACRATR
jgi:hypothetical protein